MPWHDPRTFVTGELVTASHLNAALRDNTRALAAMHRDGSTIDIGNTTTETAVFTVTIPGGELGTEHALRGEILGDYLNDSGNDRQLDLRVQLGETDLFDGSTGANVIPDFPPRRPWSLRWTLANLGSASAQRFSARFSLGRSVVPTAGQGDMDADAFLDAEVGGDATENSAADLDLTFLFKHAIANANIRIRKRYAWAQLIPGG